MAKLAGLLALALLTAPLQSPVSMPARAMDLPDDPLRSVMWEWMARLYLADGRPIVFDPAVKVLAPVRTKVPPARVTGPSPPSSRSVPAGAVNVTFPVTESTVQPALIRVAAPLPVLSALFEGTRPVALASRRNRSAAD